MKVQIVVWELVVGSGGLEKATSIKLLEWVCMYLNYKETLITYDNWQLCVRL